jgi:hypothetical protein
MRMSDWPQSIGGAPLDSGQDCRPPLPVRTVCGTGNHTTLLSIDTRRDADEGVASTVPVDFSNRSRRVRDRVQPIKERTDQDGLHRVLLGVNMKQQLVHALDYL